MHSSSTAFYTGKAAYPPTYTHLYPHAGGRFLACGRGEDLGYAQHYLSRYAYMSVAIYVSGHICQ